MTDRLREIVAWKRLEIGERRRRPLPPRPAARPAVGLAEVLRRVPFGLIAEIKRRSPSAGVLCETLDPAARARQYERGGAQAISVLVDERFFGGGETVFAEVRAATALPLLYKEFVIDEWQLDHAVALGASAVLLLAAILDEAALSHFLRAARARSLEALVEVHDESELQNALAAGAELIGINNRDLRTFQTDLRTFERLSSRVPQGVLLIAESGIHGPDDARRMRAAGAQAILVGEYLMRVADVEGAIRDLLAVGAA